METAGIRAAAWVVGKALSPLSGRVLESWAASNKLGSNIEALKMELLHAQAMLNNASGREIHNPALAEMLDKLRQLAYGADDVLDELDYFRIQDELDGTSHAADAHPAGCARNLVLNARQTARACGKHFSCFSSLQTKLKFHRVEISTRILDITEQLKPVCARVSNILNLELVKSSHAPSQDIAMNRPDTTPQIIETRLYGRDLHTKIVLDEIANSERSELTVFPIVGPGGIGKTTFVQHIYKQMKSHFQVPIWICVSLDFNANRLAKDIMEKIPRVGNENKNGSDQELIEQRLKGKRVLLVLDDVWKHSEDEWKKVIALFKKEGEKGNMVIVTTRIPEVANAVKTTKCSLELERLCSVDIMSFFEECVFGDQKPWIDHPELVDVGRKIADKLKGSPLAARTVGRLLRNKLTLNHWRSILESKEWESQTDKYDIMPALKLSYDYLPFHLQQCFSICALFPEDYEFGSDELVYLWIGLDILHSCDQKKKRIEDVGLCYLNDLVNHGFFKINEKEGKPPHYVIHDLLHELAVKVSLYECLCINSSNARDIEIPPSIRHLSIIVDDTDVEGRMSFADYDGNLNALAKRLKVENLRTLMLFGDYHGSFAKTFRSLFSEARALRIIFLSGVSYNIADIFLNISKLVHLRYLSIMLGYYDRTLVLPSVLLRLYHLVVIDLQSEYSSCSPDAYISNLVKNNMSNLVNMRHFCVPKDMPQFQSNIFGVGKLKFLQELNKFRVGKESEGFELSQLGPLTEIGGPLGIYNLENVQTKEEANELKLIHKNHVRELILEWDVKRSNQDLLKEENVLAGLVPHSNLQELRIRGHGGTNCPAWLCENLSVKYLESLCLDGVSWKNLPPLGDISMVNDLGEERQGCSISPPSFHNLKRLELSNISGLKKWVGNGACLFFSHLEVLIIRCCSELIELPFPHPTYCEAQREEKMAWFPKLQELNISDCPKLELLPSIPWRIHAPCSAHIEKVGLVKRLSYTYMPKLSLEIEGKGCQIDGLNFSSLTHLEELSMKEIPPVPLDDFRLLTSLKKIVMDGVSCFLFPVEGTGHGIYQFPVEELIIKCCSTSGKELTLLLSFLPNLSRLSIYGCENLTGLGVAENAETVSGEQQKQKRVGEEEIVTTAPAEGLLLLPPKIQELLVLRCPKVSLLPNPMGDDDHTSATGGGLQRLHSLRQLSVELCPEFLFSYSSSSSSSIPFPTCLQHLTLIHMKHMETMQTLSNLTSLTELSLIDVEGLREEGLWPLLAHGHLKKLHLYYTSDFFAGSDPSRPHDKEIFSRSSNLFDLVVHSNSGFLVAPICSLLSSTLTKLDLTLDREMKCFTKEQLEALQLLSSLQELRLASGGLQRLPGLHELINLKKLLITNCMFIQSLPSLPSSLQELDVHNCVALKSLPNDLPSSLEKLHISRCDAIKSLPKNSLPRHMLELNVYENNSKELKRACHKLIGTIPIVRAYQSRFSQIRIHF